MQCCPKPDGLGFVQFLYLPETIAKIKTLYSTISWKGFVSKFSRDDNFTVTFASFFSGKRILKINLSR